MAEIEIPGRSYLEFSATVHDRASENRFPLDGTLELTHRCNLACAHCYVNLPADDREARGRELTLDECRRLIDAMADEGCLYLLITGGEPLLRRDFRDVYLHAKRRGLLVTLFTNGCMVTPDLADFLAEYPPFSLEVTLYGATEAVYERVTGVPGSFRRCLAGIRLLRERGLVLKLKTVALAPNRHEVAAMRRMADEFGAEFKYDPHVHPRVDCSHLPCRVRMSPHEIVNLDMADPEVAEAWREEFLPENLETADTSYLYTCGAGIYNFVVDPYGALEMCLVSRHGEYHLREGGFAEGFRDYFSELRERKRERPSRCVSCDLFSVCRTCPGTSLLETGDREEPVDYLCELTRLRAATFGGLVQIESAG